MKLWKWHVTMSRKSGEIYMHRWQLLKTRLLSVYVNKICLPDEDTWLHTHPWRKSWSLKLHNWYVEELPGFPMIRVPRRLSRIPDRHRIIFLHENKPVWTLFVGWRSDRPWGFVNPQTGGVVKWQTRAKMRGLPMSAFSGGQNVDT
jgi:hypothetical protein